MPVPAGLEGQRSLNSAILLRIIESHVPTAAHTAEQEAALASCHDIPVNETTEAAARRLQGWYRRVRTSTHIKTTAVHLMTLMHHLDRDLLLFWKLLHEGVRVCKYNAKRQAKKWKVISLDKDGERLIMRPLHRTSMRFLTKSISFGRRRGITAKSEKGLYLRDIAEARIGAQSAGFARSTLEPNPDQVPALTNLELKTRNLKCFSIVGSEGTWDLELTTTAARDQVVVRLRVVLDVLQDSTSLLASREWTTPHHKDVVSLATAAHLYSVLATGVEVTRFAAYLTPARSYLWINPTTNRLCIGDSKLRVFKSVLLSDVAEVRKGVNSIAFFNLSTPPPASECCCFIGSENVLECRVTDEAARNALIYALRDLLHFMRSHPNMNATPYRATDIAAALANRP
ncbi:hypothetical protein SDRG_15165 [Saprolegnia diclina VS20]|uniref:Uncharacterized protein n=1 Tax=Saprolegnia diclina (strain VS20) TaxID=1156394 RepID=T0PXT5_SAPDV|nr:hypothetical protein SDRG_15165 [Saprolegnia diclina VS20]EQC27051.1 hypothetical protein SDRG_15165 [Saprolegnia diclina VS20]|eukprot:XP_008619551.1 hypothetical protein SDRG_15165 [Saprolegnia diclina VS20]